MNKRGQKLFMHSSDQEDIKKIQQMKKYRLPGWGYPQISKYIDIIKVGQHSTKVVTTQWSAQPISSIPGWLLLSSRNTAFKSTATFTCTDKNPDSTWQNWEFRFQRLKRTWQITGNKTARSESQKDVRFLYQTDRQTEAHICTIYVRLLSPILETLLAMGMFPDNLFSDKSMRWSFVKPPIHGGIGPSREFPLKSLHPWWWHNHLIFMNRGHRKFDQYFSFCLILVVKQFSCNPTGTSKIANLSPSQVRNFFWDPWAGGGC